jgi:hypothetical protein
MNRIAALICMAVVFAFGHAFADEVIKNRVAADKADTLEKFQAIAKEVREDMDTGGRYEYIKPDDKAKVENDLNAMAAMLQKSGSITAMTQVEKVQLFNTQENLNGILTHSDKNRLVCEHRAPVGTSIPVTTCQTVADIENARKAANKYLLDAGLNGSKCANASCRGN